MIVGTDGKRLNEIQKHLTKYMTDPGYQMDWWEEGDEHLLHKVIDYYLRNK